MTVATKVQSVADELKKFTGSEEDAQILRDSAHTLLGCYQELTNPYKPFKAVPKRVSGDSKLNLKLEEFYYLVDSVKYLKAVVRVGTLTFRIIHHNDGNIYFSSTNKPHNPTLFDALSKTYEMDYTVRNSGDLLHVKDVEEYLPLLAAKFEEIVRPIINSYIEEVTKDSILHNGVTLHNYNHNDSNFPMTVKFYSGWTIENGNDFETICNELNIGFKETEWWNILDFKSIDVFCSFMKEFGSEDIDMDILNYINKSDLGDLYFVEDSFLAWNGVLILKMESDYDSEDLNYEFLLRDPKNLIDELIRYQHINLEDLEFRDYDGQYYYFCTAAECQREYPLGEVFKLQSFFLEYNLPYKVDNKFMESIFENEERKWVSSIPLILDGAQINPYIHEKILKTFVEN